MTIGERIAALRKSMASAGWPLLPLRLVVGFGFLAHGYAKLTRGPDGFAAIVTALGLPAPLLLAWSTSLLEFWGGLFLMLGAFVVPLTVPLSAILLVAAFGVHLRYGFSSIRLQSLSPAGATFGPPGYELDLLYVAAMAALASSGPSPLSIDRWLARRRARDAQLRKIVDDETV